MEEEVIDEIEEYTIGETRSTECNHSFISAEADTKSNMLSAVCERCWHGVSYDPKQLKLESGRLVKIGDEKEK